MISNRFKTEKDREFHTKMQFEAQLSYDKSRVKHIKEYYSLDCEILSKNVIRITNGIKRLDLYETRYLKLDTGERGDIREIGEGKLICNYFNINNLNK